MHNLAHYCIEHDIHYIDECPQYKEINEDKFQRMISITDNTDIDEKNSWIFDDDDDATAKINTSTNEPKRQHKDLLTRIFELSPILTIIVPFILGISIGLVIGCNVTITSRQEQHTFMGRNRRNGDYVLKEYNPYYHTSLMDDCAPMAESTPMPKRKL